MDKELEKLYTAVSEQFDIGTLESFKSRMSTTEDRRKFYDVVSEQFDIGDYKSYEQRLSLGKSNEDSGQEQRNTSGTSTTLSQDSQAGNIDPETGLYVEGYSPDLDTHFKNMEEISITGVKSKSSFVDNLLNNLRFSSASLGEMWASAPEYLYSLGTYPQNLIADAIENNAGSNVVSDYLRVDPQQGFETVSQGQYNPLRLIRNIADYYSADMASAEANFRTYEQSITKNLTEGNLIEVGEQAFDEFIRSSGAILSMMATGGTSTISRGLLTALPFASAEYQELSENPDVNQNLAPVYAALKGGAEVVFERSDKISSDILSGLIGTREVKGILEGFARRALSVNGIPASIVNGGISEGATVLSQEVIDVVSGAKEQIDYGAVLDATVTGSIIDGGLGSVRNVADAVVRPSNSTRVRELQTQIEQELQDVNNPNLSDTTVDNIRESISEKVQEIDNIVNSDNINNIPDEQRNRVVELNTEIDNINADLETLEVSDSTRESLENRKTAINEELESIAETSTPDVVEDSQVAPVGTEVEQAQELVTEPTPEQKFSDMQQGGLSQNNAPKTQDFFTSIVEGTDPKFKPSRPYELEANYTPEQQAFEDRVAPKRGNFDEHIATSIPQYRETQTRKGAGIVSVIEGRTNPSVLDIGGSEGNMVKVVTELTGAKTVNLEPNDAMANSHESSPVQRSEVIREAFYEGFDDVPAHTPTEKYDVVNESMVFQFITPERKQFIDHLADVYLKEDGIFISEEKLKTREDLYIENETKKDTDHKSKYYSEEQLRHKSDQVLTGMDVNQADVREYIEALKDRFTHVGLYWNSGNFYGIAASNSKETFDTFMQSVGDTTSPYTVVPLGEVTDVSTIPSSSDVQQTETFSAPEQSEIVNTLSSDQNFLARLNDSAQRSTRIQELEQRLRDNIRQAGNLGITQDGEQQARQNIEFIRDLTEYAVLRIADGTIKTANALADALSIPRGDVNVQQAFEDAQQINTIIQESTVTPRRQTVKSTIRQSTQGGTRGTVQLTNRQALTQRIRTLNEGARLGKRDIKEIRQGVSDLLKDLNEAKAFKGKVNATAIRRVANMVNNANTPKQVERATSVIEKVVDDAKFAQRLADIDNYKARIKRIAKSKSTPKDLGRVLSGFSNINARDLEVSNLDEYLMLAESIYRRETSVSNVNNENLQKLIDMANANKEERQAEREVRSQTPEAQQLKITALRNNLVDRLGVEESVINEIDNGSKPLDEVITELQAIVDEMRSTREDAVRNIADEYVSEIKSNKDSILEGVVNPVERRLVEEFIDLDSTQSDVTKSTLGKYVTTLYNLLNNSSGVGLGDVITEIKRNRAISDKAKVDNLQSFLVTPSKLFSNLNAAGATSGSQVFDAIVKNKENIGDLHEFTGFADVQIKSVQAQTRIEKIKQDFNKLVEKHSKDLNNNPEGEVLMSIYADAVQYRRSWDAEQIANEFNLRIEAWGESLVRMQKKASSNSEYAKANKSVISTLEKVLERIADRTTVDGKEVWSAKVNQEELFNMLSNGHRELYKFMRSTFSELQNEHFAISRVYGGLDVETDWVNYIPRNYTSIPSTSETAVARSLASATGRIQDAGDINFNQSLTKENTGSGKTRLISGNKLPLNKTLNTRSINTFLTEMGGIVYDIETMAERKFTASMLDFERNGLKFEDEVPLNLYKEKVAQKILGDRFSTSVGDLKPSVLKRAFSKVSRLGTAVALGGAPQFIKQTTPLVETFGRVSNPKHVWTAMQYVFSSETQDLLKMGDVTLRNIENEITMPSTDNNLVTSEQANEMIRMLRDFGVGADKLSEKAIKLSLSPLKITDDVVAKIGWLSLYIDRASQRNGGVIDFSKPDRNAIAYANTQNSIVMNESDPALQGRFLRTNWLRMMFPFSSFSINSKITLFQSIDRLIKANNASDRARYAAQVSTNLGNIALFNAIGYGIRAAAISSGAYFLNTIISNSDSDEEEKKELLEELSKDTENRQALNNIRSVGYLTQDFLFGGLFGKFLEPATESATDYVIRATYGDDELRARGFSNAGAMIDKEWYEDLFTVMGTAGIYGQRVADTWKLASDLGESDKDYVTRRFREVNSLKDDIVIDSWYLDPANIDKYTKPEWERASVTQATLLSAMSLTGLSDQWLGSSRRYMSTLSRNLLSKDHGKVSAQSKRELIESSKKITNIKLGKTEIPLDYEQKIWYYNEYYNTALQERNNIPKPKGQSETEYEKLITSISESKMKINFLDRYRKQFDKSVDKYIKEARKDAEENSNKIRYYNR